MAASMKSQTLPPVRVRPELFDRLKQMADEEYCKFSEYLREVLTAHAEKDGRLPPSGASEHRERRFELDNALKEIELAKATCELVPQLVAIEEHMRAVAPVRQAIQQVEYAVSELTERQRDELIKWKEDMLNSFERPAAGRRDKGSGNQQGSALTAPSHRPSVCGKVRNNEATNECSRSD